MQHPQIVYRCRSLCKSCLGFSGLPEHLPHLSTTPLSGTPPFGQSTPSWTQYNLAAVTLQPSRLLAFSRNLARSPGPLPGWCRGACQGTSPPIGQQRPKRWRRRGWRRQRIVSFWERFTVFINNLTAVYTSIYKVHYCGSFLNINNFSPFRLFSYFFYFKNKSGDLFPLPFSDKNSWFESRHFMLAKYILCYLNPHELWQRWRIPYQFYRKCAVGSHVQYSGHAPGQWT